MQGGRTLIKRATVGVQLKRNAADDARGVKPDGVVHLHVLAATRHAHVLRPLELHVHLFARDDGAQRRSRGDWGGAVQLAAEPTAAAPALHCHFALREASDVGGRVL